MDDFSQDATVELPQPGKPGRWYIVPTHDKSGPEHGLTDDLAATIAAEVRIGANPRDAAIACGVSKSSWYRWAKEAARGEQPTAARMGKIHLAESAFIVEVEQSLAGYPEWQCKAFMLKAKRREIYNEKHVAGEEPVEAALGSDLTDEQIETGLRERNLPSVLKP
jgi:hypothetical protein